MRPGRTIRRYLAAAALVLASALPTPLFSQAESTLALTVTPPLFQLSLKPGEAWSSSLKVVNTNPYPLELYAIVMDVEAEGERGRSRFLPLTEDDPSEEGASGGATLGHWVSVESGPRSVPPGASSHIPFSIQIPENAGSGGHYAAILIGTQPVYHEGSGPIVNVSSFISSLLFVRIEGAVIEEGRIRQFTTDKTFYDSPKVDFALRFENTGTVHVQPQGDITVYNMWGKERGKVFVNHKSNFGNVLPGTTRAFSFTWTGEEHAFEIGPYSAVATLAYGSDNRKNVLSERHFWIIPVVPVLSVFGGFFTFALLVVWFIRRYIRRALALEAIRLGVDQEPPRAESAQQENRPHISTEAFTRPFSQGVVDLRSVSWHAADADSPPSGTGQSSPLSPSQFFRRYRLFFIFLLVCVIGVLGFAAYFNEVLLSERSFDIKTAKGDEGILIEGE